MSANYFQLIKAPTFKFTQYRIDFEPEVDLMILRKVFIGQQRELLGGYLYDGDNLLFLTHTLPEDRLEFEVQSREGGHYKMTLKKTGMVIQMTDGMAMQILNLILRRAMDGLHMELVGRNLYDAESRVS